MAKLLKKPKRLFKYCAFNQNSLKMLINNTIWLSSPGQFNDPYEDVFFWDIESIFNKTTVTMDWDRSNHIVETNINTSYLYCLSAKHDDLLMWAHYGFNHTGFCIGFDINKAPFNDAFKIDYNETNKLPQLCMNPFIEKNVDGITKEVNKIFSIKSIDWEYEEEWRICIKDRNQNGALGIEVEFEPSAITSITFGHRMSGVNKQTLINIFKNRNVDFFDAELDRFKYKVNVIGRDL